jgi:hypothetical protein
MSNEISSLMFSGILNSFLTIDWYYIHVGFALWEKEFKQNLEKFVLEHQFYTLQGFLSEGQLYEW